MNRSRRLAPAAPKPFVSGGVYDPKQQVTTSKPKPQQPASKVETPQPVLQQQVKALQPPPKAPQGLDLQSEPPVVAPVVQNMVVDSDSVVDENGKPQFKKIFQTRKKSSVRAKEKKIRQNRQLRKAILPKNALMALNEVKSLTISDFAVNNSEGGGFNAVVTVNNIQYEAKGHSKMAAKNNACEKALRDYVIARMVAKPRFPSKNQASSTSESVEAMDTGDNSNNESDNGGDDSDDVPMVNLASFALFKLFSEWESEGYVIPEMHPPAPGAGSADGNEAAGKEPKEPKKSAGRGFEKPDKWEDMHPASLLCYMRPGLGYTFLGTVGEKPNILQSLSVVVDNEEFIAYGRSKKTARRNAAVAVCNKLFQTNFTKDEPFELPIKGEAATNETVAIEEVEIA